MNKTLALITLLVASVYGREKFLHSEYKPIRQSSYRTAQSYQYNQHTGQEDNLNYLKYMSYNRRADSNKKIADGVKQRMMENNVRPSSPKFLAAAPSSYKKSVYSAYQTSYYSPKKANGAFKSYSYQRPSYYHGASYYRGAYSHRGLQDFSTMIGNSNSSNGTNSTYVAPSSYYYSFYNYYTKSYWTGPSYYYSSNARKNWGMIEAFTAHFSNSLDMRNGTAGQC